MTKPQAPLWERRVSASASEQPIYLRYFTSKPKGPFGVKSDFSKLLFYKDHLAIRIGGIPIVQNDLVYDIPYSKIDAMEKAPLGMGIMIRHHAAGVPKYIGIAGAWGPFDSIFSEIKDVVKKHKLNLEIDF